MAEATAKAMAEPMTNATAKVMAEAMANAIVEVMAEAKATAEVTAEGGTTSQQLPALIYGFCGRRH